MTKQELNDLFDYLNYGHDAELELKGIHYFIEWSNSGIEIYKMNNDNGFKIAVISTDDKNRMLDKILEYKFEGNYSLNSNFALFNVIDIE